MSDESPVSYVDLVRLRQEQWRQAQTILGQQIQELQERVAQMPDVRDAPRPGDAFEAKDLWCARCGAPSFTMRRWVTVNGMRHRTELACRACGLIGTWDWDSRAWL